MEDIRHKSLSAESLLVCCTAAVVTGIITDKFMASQYISGAIFIALLAAVSIITNCIGMGDVVVSAIILCLKGTVFTVLVFTFAMTLLGVINIIRILVRKVSRKYTVPFVPYMGICAAGMVLCG